MGGLLISPPGYACMNADAHEGHTRHVVPRFVSRKTVEKLNSQYQKARGCTAGFMDFTTEKMFLERGDAELRYCCMLF